MHIGNLFRLSYWLDPSVLDHRAGAAMWLVIAAGLLWSSITLILAIRKRARHSYGMPFDIALAQVVAGLIAAAVALGRLYALAPLGLRAGWLIAVAIAAAPLAPRILRQALRDGVLSDALAVMAFVRPAPSLQPWHPATLMAWLGLHLLGLAAVLSIARWPIWLAPLLLLLILAPPFLTRWRAPNLQSRPVRWAAISNLSSLQPATLAPLLLVYAVLALRLAASIVARLTIGEFRVVEPFGALLNLPLALIVMTGYALAASAHQASSIQRPTPFVKAASLALVAGVVAWAGWTALTLHTHGVSGSDPYAYAQMGVDLAERGTVFHPFPLVRLTYGLNIPSEPIIHIGYRLPQDVQRVATTVWPPGYAVFTGLAYKLFGEQGLYLVTPMLSLLSLAVVWFLTRTLTPSPSPPGRGEAGPGGRGQSAFRWAVAALAVFITATSYQQVEWQLIPMADIAAQLFSLLALGLALGGKETGVRRHAKRSREAVTRSGHAKRSALGTGHSVLGTPHWALGTGHSLLGTRHFLLAALSGLALGMAFDIRYTQVLIAPALAFALWDWARPHTARPFSGKGPKQTLEAEASAGRVDPPKGSASGAEPKHPMEAEASAGRVDPPKGSASGAEPKHPMEVEASAGRVDPPKGSASGAGPKHPMEVEALAGQVKPPEGSTSSPGLAFLNAHGLQRILICALFALIGAAPVLIYHTLAFGSPLHTGSEELVNFSLARLPETWTRLMAELTSPREFGLLLPLIVIGAIVLWRQQRRAMFTLILYVVPLFALHIAYAYLRPRDILPLFPVLAILAALGAGWLVVRLAPHSNGAFNRRRSALPLLRATLLIILSYAFVLRSLDTLALPVTKGFGAFGYLVREQRVSFTRLGELTPPDAVIACSLNSGAVDLHARRLTFRPATWTPAELLSFVRALAEENTPVYILEDGAELARPLATLRQHFRLDEVARLDMPYYFPGSGSENRKVPLYRVRSTEF